MTIRSALLLFLAGIVVSCSTSEISVRKDALKQVKTVAVLPFTAEKGISDEVARDCMESFKSHMIRSGFKLIERQALDKILAEKELAMTGLTADSSMELGKLLSADGLLTGQITRHSSETVDENVQLSAYGPDAYTPEKDPGDGTFFKKNGEWYRKTKMKVFNFQIFVRLLSAKDGQVALTLQNAMPVAKFEVDRFNTPGSIDEYRGRVLQQMGKDLNEALKKK